MSSLLVKLFASDWFWNLGEIFLAAALFFAVGFYAYRESFDKTKFIGRLRLAAKLTVLARLFYAGFLTFAQYFIWNQSEVSRVFLTFPADAKSLPTFGFLAPLFEWRSGYFTLYSFSRFWLPAIASVFIAWLFFLFLKSLKKYKERFFEDGELELGWVLALVVGYPKFIIFLPLIFALIIPISIVRFMVLKQRLTTIGYPILLAGIVAAIWGIRIIDFLGWGGLKV